jgi:hypothetical protein
MVLSSLMDVVEMLLGINWSSTLDDSYFQSLLNLYSSSGFVVEIHTQVAQSQGSTRRHTLPSIDGSIYGHGCAGVHPKSLANKIISMMQIKCMYQ